MIVRKTGGRTELDTYAKALRGLLYRLLHSIDLSAAVGDGTTNGQLRTTVAVVPSVDGIANASLASTDDFWDLSAEVDTAAAKFRAYWLYVSAANAASFAAGSDMDSEADALQALPALDTAQAILGVYVAGPVTDFTAALAAQGTISQRVPDGASGVLIDSDITLVAR